MVTNDGSRGSTEPQGANPRAPSKNSPQGTPDL